MTLRAQYSYIRPFAMKSAGDTATISMFTDDSVSFNGGPRHGHAFYIWDPHTELGSWVIRFHYLGDESKAKDLEFHQMPGTDAFFYKGITPEWNAMLLPEQV